MLVKVGTNSDGQKNYPNFTSLTITLTVMQTDETLIRQVKKMFEEKTGWGDSENWTNQDFLQLSELIRDQTGVTLSHVTLKRVWGKVKYDSLPNTHTLNTLAQFLGYDNWRDFTVQHTTTSGTNPATTEPTSATTSNPNTGPTNANPSPNPANANPISAGPNPTSAGSNPIAGPQTARANQTLT